MKLTTKGRYAVTAMLDLALHGRDGPVSLAEISTRQEISLSYLEQLFSKLRKNDLVVSTRGPGGGYSVARRLSEVAVSEIISAVNESVDATQCAGKENCHGHGRCLTHDLWEGLSAQIEEFLSSVSLQDMIDNQRVQRVSLMQEKSRIQDSLLSQQPHA
ncbi:MAG: Fe-S cluster assembly transcriptional regulator IscR [Granulosicoccus sp.]|nr:Fe-S cluster assembly transcriptional regulator IscR [Granulosicoccus sp.]